MWGYFGYLLGYFSSAMLGVCLITLGLIVGCILTPYAHFINIYKGCLCKTCPFYRAKYVHLPLVLEGV